VEPLTCLDYERENHFNYTRSSSTHRDKVKLILKAVDILLTVFRLRGSDHIATRGQNNLL